MIEPFPVEPDPGCYVPRPASDLAIRELERALAGRQTRIVLLYGPPGIGKSVVLNQVALAVKPPDVCLRMDHGGLTPDALCGWLARELDVRASEVHRELPWHTQVARLLSPRSARSRSPAGDLVRQIEGLDRVGARVIALIDEADDVDADAVRELAAITRRVSGAFRICLASSDPDLPARVTDCAQVVHYLDPLSETETREYVHARLSRAHLGAEYRSRLDARGMQRLHRFSGGNPRRLHAELSLIRMELATASAPSLDPSELPPPEPATPVEPVTPAEPAMPAELATPAGPDGPDASQALADASSSEAPAGPQADSLSNPPSSPTVPSPPEVETATTFEPSSPGPRELPRPSRRRRAGGWTAALLAVGVTASYVGWRYAERTPGLVTVQINADPWAEISLNGQPIGETPLGDVEVPAGRHLFRAAFEDGRVVEREVEIHADQRWVYFE